MITCHRRHLEERCRQRGYTMDEVYGCIVRADGDMITVDITHRDYPRAPKPEAASLAQGVASGPGTELKKLLARFGIHAGPGCPCSSRARLMDEREAAEPGWCDAHIEDIVGWLKSEAARRRMPFWAPAARLLVRMAIRKARKHP